MPAIKNLPFNYLAHAYSAVFGLSVIVFNSGYNPLLEQIPAHTDEAEDAVYLHAVGVHGRYDDVHLVTAVYVYHRHLPVRQYHRQLQQQRQRAHRQRYQLR